MISFGNDLQFWTAISPGVPNENFPTKGPLEIPVKISNGGIGKKKAKRRHRFFNPWRTHGDPAGILVPRPCCVWLLTLPYAKSQIECPVSGFRGQKKKLVLDISLEDFVF